MLSSSLSNADSNRESGSNPAGDPAWMRAAIEAARESVSRGAGGPFGACIVREGQVLSTSSNHVLLGCDPTAHAEVMAIRLACQSLQFHLLEGADIYSTTEPCPMCFASLHWARVGRIFYGTNIDDVTKLGFNEMPISNFQMREMARSQVEIVPDFLREECLGLLQFWSEIESRRTY